MAAERQYRYAVLAGSAAVEADPLCESAVSALIDAHLGRAIATRQCSVTGTWPEHSSTNWESGRIPPNWPLGSPSGYPMT